MSDVARYTAAGEGIVRFDEEGPLVVWQDYARLRAEVERLTAVSEAWKKRRLDKVEAECIKWSDYEHLKAEVERLRKAGDEMHRAIKVSDPILDWKIELWNAAKEGKPSV